MTSPKLYFIYNVRFVEFENDILVEYKSIDEFQDELIEKIISFILIFSVLLS